VQCDTTVYEMLSAMDQVLASEVGNADDLAELEGLVHCAALATCQVLDCKVRTRDETNAAQQKSKSEQKPNPTWKKRLEEKVNRSGRDIGHLAKNFQKTENSSKKVRVGVRIILKRLRVKASVKELVKKLKMEDERLRQRIADLGARIRRYNEAAKRRESGALFPANQAFLPNLRKVEQTKASDKISHLPPV
jgi:hypothetical protein